MKKTMAATFLDAADYIDAGRPNGHPACCIALAWASQGMGEKNYKDMQEGFAKVFQPKRDPAYWFGNNFSGHSILDNMSEKRNRQHRVYAMLFMSELAKDVGL